ncbi:hypothetical protein ACNKHT_10220 [Shigella flexneri]
MALTALSSLTREWHRLLVDLHLTEVFLGIFIGAVVTGSVVAFGKLCGKVR